MTYQVTVYLRTGQTLHFVDVEDYKAGPDVELFPAGSEPTLEYIDQNEIVAITASSDYDAEDEKDDVESIIYGLVARGATSIRHVNGVLAQRGHEMTEKITGQLMYAMISDGRLRKNGSKWIVVRKQQQR